MFQNKLVIVACLFAIGLTACELPQEGPGRDRALPEPESAGAKLVKQYCANCHAPPLPVAHTAKEWPNVIYRMQERRRSKAYKRMPDEERSELLAYLQKHARQS